MRRTLVAAVDEYSADRQRAWMAGLPHTVEELAERWSLGLDEPFQPGGQTAWVAPARRGTNVDLVLKVGLRHTEAAHEADGLREWDGRGAVRIYATAEFDDTTALLLE